MSLFRRDGRRGAEPRGSRASTAGGNRRRDRADSQAPAGAAAAAPRRRIARAVGRLALALAATSLVLWGCVAVYRAATTAEYFSVTEIRITGNSRLSEAEVIAAAAVERGLNVFRLDVEEAARQLRQHPWVLEASAVRRLPRGLEIAIVERKAEALVLFDVPYLVDDSGTVFKRWAPGDPTPAPIISGLSREHLAGDRAAVQESINAAIALARRYRAQGLDRAAPLSEIHAEVDGGFSLTVGAEPFYARLGKGPYRQKLARLADLLRRLRADGMTPAVVHFDNEIRPDRITVKVRPRPGADAASGVQVTRTP